MILNRNQLKQLILSSGFTEAQVAINAGMTRNYLNNISLGKSPATPEKLLDIVTKGMRLPLEVAREHVFIWQLENLCTEYGKPSIPYVSPLQIKSALSSHSRNPKPLEERDLVEQLMYKLDVSPSFAMKMVEALSEALKNEP